MQKPNTACGYVAFLGAPNAGKSTLLNQLLGQKLAIVTPKAQTTRSRISGVMVEDNAQIILLDVPGVFDAPSNKPFEQAMVAAAWSAVADADIVAMMIDARRGLDDENKQLIARLTQSGKKAILVLNKVDALDSKEKLLPLIAQANSLHHFAETFPISALKGTGVDALKHYLARAVPAGVWLYPEDYLTDLPERLIAAEITREQCFLKLREELPYALTVETESWEELNNGGVKISQAIIVEREGQKGIVLGKGGAMLKSIGEAARHEISRTLDRKAHVFLFVKVRENWKSQRDAYSQLGLEFKG